MKNTSKTVGLRSPSRDSQTESVLTKGRIIGYIILVENEISAEADYTLHKSVEEAKSAIKELSDEGSFTEDDTVTIHPVLASEVRATFNGVRFENCLPE